MSKGNKVMVVGSGGREHALALRLLKSASIAEVVVTPGNAGTLKPPNWLSDKVLRNAVGAPLEVATAEKPNLVVIGPEAPLASGLTDELTRAGFVVFGPTRHAARLEGSKAFMKALARELGIKTAHHVVVSDPGELEAALEQFPEPPVVKADGLCAGKGVTVAETHAEALEVGRTLLSGERFGEAGKLVVLEERLTGEEASCHAICDGEHVAVLPAAQDHKRIFDADKGPNTGGMGAYAPAPVVSDELLLRIEREIFQRTIHGMRDQGSPFRGALYAGLMITRSGDPYLIEFNVRFGDPETQVLMNVIEGDFALALAGAAEGQLYPNALRPSNQHAVCVVLAAHGYPDAPRAGDVITGIEAAEAIPGVLVYHAGTRWEADRLVTAGGRILGVTAHAESLTLARERAYLAADQIQFAGKQLRTDIAARALGTRL